MRLSLFLILDASRREVRPRSMTCSRNSSVDSGINRYKQGWPRLCLPRLRSDEFVRGSAVSEPWLSADDIASHLGVTKDTVYAWIADKGMPAHKVGRLWKFPTTEVADWVRRGGAAPAHTGEGGDRRSQ